MEAPECFKEEVKQGIVHLLLINIYYQYVYYINALLMKSLFTNSYKLLFNVHILTKFTFNESCGDNSNMSIEKLNYSLVIRNCACFRRTTKSIVYWSTLCARCAII